MTFRKNYTNEDIKNAVKNNFSIAGVLQDLGLVKAGGNYNNIKRKIAILDLDTSHFTGKIWSKGKRLKDYKDYKKSSNLKLNLIKERGRICENCGNNEWMGFPISLELHHKDGNSVNNNLSNLELLCPNCHSMTTSWRRQKT